ncbi:hypothetical protein SAMN02799631_05216 [Methylobacterium sp. 174MFSha1.1]|uniref:DUF6163 family protein n=1 Tax=Methylobacterium sp. 174MFSha1.1 TaxID=1502749 RepID=UPI0008EF1DF7|nr:DUF6163 family protein [Methylobacterium sp. 174MFSha1.1]SFV11121.1 hypothetical protein SAMN02799631_05216 [Methylobacterium sp. 174MFSha1.1]
MRSLSKVRGGPRRAGIDEAADRIERRPPRPETRWDVVLVWLMRVVAVVWMVKGLSAWAEILGARPNAAPFETAPIGRQAVIVYFGVINLLAAVGLWLATAWGGVVWLLAATSAIVLALLTPQLLPMSIPSLAFDSMIILVYFTVSWLASRELR